MPKIVLKFYVVRPTFDTYYQPIIFVKKNRAFLSLYIELCTTTFSENKNFDLSTKGKKVLYSCEIYLSGLQFFFPVRSNQRLRRSTLRSLSIRKH